MGSNRWGYGSLINRNAHLGQQVLDGWMVLELAFESTIDPLPHPRAGLLLTPLLQMTIGGLEFLKTLYFCLLYTSPSPRDRG